MTGRARSSSGHMNSCDFHIQRMTDLEKDEITCYSKVEHFKQLILTQSNLPACLLAEAEREQQRWREIAYSLVLAAALTDKAPAAWLTQA